MASLGLLGERDVDAWAWIMLDSLDNWRHDLALFHASPLDWKDQTVVGQPVKRTRPNTAVSTLEALKEDWMHVGRSNSQRPQILPLVPVAGSVDLHGC